MNPANLTPGKQYHYTIIDQPLKPVIYRYETLNHWLFDKVNETGFVMLHKQQVISNITEI